MPAVSARFHRAVAGATARACTPPGAPAPTASGCRRVAIFQNRLLLELCGTALEDTGLRVLVPEQVPANDGGISYGQAAVAAARLARAG